MTDSPRLRSASEILPALSLTGPGRFGAGPVAQCPGLGLRVRLPLAPGIAIDIPNRIEANLLPPVSVPRDAKSR